MKKEECISKFVASLIIAFPFMAMFAFLVELFTIENFIDISKNHGSLVAGILGAIGTFVLVVIQIRLNREAIKESRDLVHEERFEIERDRALNSIDCINSCVIKTAGAVMNPKLQKCEFLRRFIADTDTLIESMPIVINFCQKKSSQDREAESIYTSLSFMLFYTYIVNSLLNLVLNDIEVNEYLICDMEEKILARLLDEGICIDAALKDQAIENIRIIAGNGHPASIMRRWTSLNHDIFIRTKDWIVFTDY